ncbi:YigZ family protein [Desemzia sp. RIT804]|uniref:YigZ family protein n=1 Tax=Desemzia sp. RIT 804 TaxID=2810209 RepID=UPI001951AED6|nr:YigZ family protein [Desemzia sp. RIT 804]MBM6615582.1 YigZ family protein [Desemzia sp. RIT 804]
MLKRYRTIEKDGQFEIEIKKSRFICHLKRVNDENEATAFIAAVKKEHSKATHNCSAYLIGDQNEVQRAHDDGEPSGTAGVPMLEVLKKKDLKNVATVVTRYFGGVKLGAGGLIRAYGNSVSRALEEIGLVEGHLQIEIRATIEYPLLGKVENLLHESPYTIKDIVYTDKVTFSCMVNEDETAHFYRDVVEWVSNQVSFEEGALSYYEVKIND